MTDAAPDNDAIAAAARSLMEWWDEAGVDAPPPPRAPARRPAAAPAKETKRRPPARPGPAAQPQARPAGEDAALKDARRMAAGADSLDALKSAVESFEGCSLKQSARNTVFARGSMKSGLMIIGEAPGFDEDAKGEPFVGRSGQLLDRMVGAIGLDREEIYVTNILFWRPPGNRNPSDTDIQTCLAFVERHIALAQPKVIALAGKMAAQTLLKESDGIMRLRGKWRDYTPTSGDEDAAQTIPALPIFHPAFLLRQPGYKRQTWKDLLSLQERLGL